MSLPLIVQGLQSRVTALEAAGRRCNHGDRLDMLERDVINVSNSIDVLRMGMGGKTGDTQSAVDNVVIASLRGAVDGLCKREFAYAAELTNLVAALADMSDSVRALEGAVDTRQLEVDVRQREVDTQQLEVEARQREVVTKEGVIARSVTMEVAALRAEFEAVGRAAVEHARAGRADIDAIKRELEHLKKRGE
jgi:hypothetical protein